MKLHTVFAAAVVVGGGGEVEGVTNSRECVIFISLNTMYIRDLAKASKPGGPPLFLPEPVTHH